MAPAARPSRAKAAKSEEKAAAPKASGGVKKPGARTRGVALTWLACMAPLSCGLRGDDAGDHSGRARCLLRPARGARPRAPRRRGGNRTCRAAQRLASRPASGRDRAATGRPHAHPADGPSRSCQAQGGNQGGGQARGQAGREKGARSALLREATRLSRAPPRTHQPAQRHGRTRRAPHAACQMPHGPHGRGRSRREAGDGCSAVSRLQCHGSSLSCFRPDQAHNPQRPPAACRLHPRRLRPRSAQTAACMGSAQGRGGWAARMAWTCNACARRR